MILDAQPRPLAGSPFSALDLPLADGCLLDRLRRDLPDDGDDVTIVRPWAEVAENAHFAARHGLAPAADVVTMAGLLRKLAQQEPSDWLVFIDPLCYLPGGWPARELLHMARRGREVTHLVAALPDTSATEERVLLDAAGHVRRIQRYYAGVTRVRRCRIACSAMPSAVAQTVLEESAGSLLALRRTLASYGIPSREIFAKQGVLELERTAGLLALLSHELPDAGAAAGRHAARRGSGCCVHPRARLLGPVVLHDGARIAADATLIGPVLVGPHARIERGSVVSRCLLLPGARVAAGALVQQCVLAHEQRASAADAADAGQGGAADVPASAAAAAARVPPTWYLPVKRVLDACLAGGGLLVLAPLLLAAALVVKLTSRGPVLFGHERETLGGREFRCWKFRTMVANAHTLQRRLYTQNTVDGPQFKLDHDPRITRIGHWLRTANIDELPQLLNVLVGQMSLIGPRPSPFRENQICVPWRQARLSVRPGITGLWQICRHDRWAGDFHQWIHFDMLYVRHMSPWLDAKIVLFTLLTLGGRWSVPLRWLIPQAVAAAPPAVAISRRVPILESPSEVLPPVTAVSAAGA